MGTTTHRTTDSILAKDSLTVLVMSWSSTFEPSPVRMGTALSLSAASSNRSAKMLRLICPFLPARVCSSFCQQWTTLSVESGSGARPCAGLTRPEYARVLTHLEDLIIRPEEGVWHSAPQYGHEGVLQGLAVDKNEGMTEGGLDPVPWPRNSPAQLQSDQLQVGGDLASPAVGPAQATRTIRLSD